MILDTIGGLSARGRRRRQGAIASGNPVVEDVFSTYVYRGNNNSSNSAQRTQAIVNNIALADAADEWTVSSNFSAKSFGGNTGEDLIEYVVPKGVTSISAVGVGGGGGCISSDVDNSIASGTGGSLRYKNSVSVTEGDVFTVKFTRSNGYRGVSVQLIDNRDGSNTVILSARGGNLPYYHGSAFDVTNIGDGGGNGGTGASHTINTTAGGLGGGGAGGYTGNGGAPGLSGGGSGSGGGGGGGDGFLISGSTGTRAGGSGGGVYLYGTGDSGAGGTDGDNVNDPPGAGQPGSQNNVSDGRGSFGSFGGGRGVRAPTGYGGSNQESFGGEAGIRIIGNLGGVTREFPNTNVGTNSDTTNQIGQGGLIWIKARTQNNTGLEYHHELMDSERNNFASTISTNNTDQTVNFSIPGSNFTSLLAGVNSNGFTVAGAVNSNNSEEYYTSWTFRKAPKFFDIVTWSGDGTAGRTIPHNLTSRPGMIITKCTNDGTVDWTVWHRSRNGSNTHMRLETSVAQPGEDISAATENDFTVGNDNRINGVGGREYVAYVFAHNNNDGIFGINGDQDIIKCGSYSTDSLANATIDLGWEPQWILFRPWNDSSDWKIVDNIRGFFGEGARAVDSANYNKELNPNRFTSELNNDQIELTSTGFNHISGFASKEFVYMAIRRGPMALPTSGTEVFDIKLDKATGFPGWISSTGVVDFAIRKFDYTVSGAKYVDNRLLGRGSALIPNSNTSDSGGASYFDYNNGYNYGTNNGSAAADYAAWMWKRAPGFLDVISYLGSGSGGRSIQHNLGVAPEMVWIKARTGANRDWVVWDAYSDIASKTYGLMSLNRTEHDWINYSALNNTPPTSTQITLGNHQYSNDNNVDYLAFLFASLPGISKVGSYIGNGTQVGDSQVIDCGFTTGARFVLIKRTDNVDDWHMFDTARGINTGSEPLLRLNSDDGEGSDDYIDPDPSGFKIEYGTGGSSTNLNGAKYIFYAIA